MSSSWIFLACSCVFISLTIAVIVVKSAIIVVGDATKADSSSMIKYCNWEDVDIFVTNKSLPKYLQEEIGKKTELILV